MSDDPIERAARALAKRYLDREQATDLNFFKLKYPYGEEQYLDQEWPKYAGDARAVIAAIRTPTESMLEAAEDIAFPDGEDVWTGPKPEETWSVMIDRLLWEPKEK